MSGNGKSTLITALTARGYKAIDLDTDEWSQWVPLADSERVKLTDSAQASIWDTQDWVWREDRVERLLAVEDADILFVSGTAANQGRFRERFDHIILLSAPKDVIVERLTTRTNSSYGKDPNELARVLKQVDTVEPLLRKSATFEVDTSASISDVLRIVLDASH
jgi:dephospho-CoA kinase